MSAETIPYDARSRWLPRLRPASIWHWTLLVVVALAVLAPLAFLVLGSLSSARLPTEFSFFDLTFANYATVWGDPATYRLFGSTIIYVTGCVIFGVSLAAILAWLVERTDMPGKIWIYAGVPMTLAMPGMLQAMAWVLLLSPRTGMINKSLQWMFGLEEAPINVYSLGGMIFVEGVRLVPTAFLMLVPLLRSMDPTLEEAAAMSGARPSATIRKITLRLMLPGLLGVVIFQAVTALEVFEVPGILGMPAGIYVLSTKVYALLHSATGVPSYGQANALSTLYLLIALFATWAYARVIARGERFTIVTGKGYRPRLQPLGRWRWPAVALVVFFLTVSIILPFLVFLYISFIPYLQLPSARAFQNMSLANYAAVFNRDLIGKAVWNTVVLTAATGILTLVLSFVISLTVVRSRFRQKRLLDQLSFAPHAVPGIVMGVAFFWLYLKLETIGIPLFGGILSMVIAFTVSYLAYGTRALNAALLQIHKDLEEAAYVSGAVQWRTMWRIFVPLLMPAFLGVFVWTILHVVRSASLPLMLFEGPQNQVLAVLIWNMWDQGDVPIVGAMGVMMITVLLLITLAFRAFAFGGNHTHGAKAT